VDADQPVINCAGHQPLGDLSRNTQRFSDFILGLPGDVIHPRSTRSQIHFLIVLTHAPIPTGDFNGRILSFFAPSRDR
jgi:hypothetical protein